jgi:hypothetical protein
MLTERTGVKAEDVAAELAELEKNYRERSKTLKALLRALGAEKPEAEKPEAEKPKAEKPEVEKPPEKAKGKK